jgi:putative ATP-binding cassette transporter
MLQETYRAPEQKYLISRFWQSASGFWRGPTWVGWLLIALLIVIVVLQLVVQYWLNFGIGTSSMRLSKRMERHS